MSVRPEKTQISLGILPVWSESSLSAWRNLRAWATHWAQSEDSDQTGRMPRLIWVFAGRTLIVLVLSFRGSFSSKTWSLRLCKTTYWDLIFKKAMLQASCLNVPENCKWFLLFNNCIQKGFPLYCRQACIFWQFVVMQIKETWPLRISE